MIFKFNDLAYIFSSIEASQMPPIVIKSPIIVYQPNESPANATPEMTPIALVEFDIRLLAEAGFITLNT